MIDNFFTFSHIVEHFKHFQIHSQFASVIRETLRKNKFRPNQIDGDISKKQFFTEFDHNGTPGLLDGGNL